VGGCISHRGEEGPVGVLSVSAIRAKRALGDIGYHHFHTVKSHSSWGSWDPPRVGRGKNKPNGGGREGRGTHSQTDILNSIISLSK
jgi:hypothetical protein